VAAVTHTQATSEQSAAVVFSRGLAALKHLQTLVGVDRILSRNEYDTFDGHVSSVLVWGRKSNTRGALEFAAQRDLPVQYLEDGWIRSSSSNPHNRVCYSILLDNTGVYYDSRTPNDIENLLNIDESDFANRVSKSQLDYAKSCRLRMISSNISKYNFNSQQPSVLHDGDQPLVLVVDQTLDDASVRFGGMDAERFTLMLQTAIEENPDAKVVVRAHPDVVSGRKQGYLNSIAKSLEIEVSAEGNNPIVMLQAADKVYVGTSQLGYEALLCEKPVVVFGQPFYAGWGLTDDRMPVARRMQQRSIDELFHVSHIEIARYCNPITGKQWQLHECLDHVELQQDMFARNARDFLCTGITPWKQRYIRQYLRSPEGSVSFAREFGVPPSGKNAHLTWGYRAHSNIPSDAPQKVKDQSLFRLEDGFLRSAGLGSDFNAPASLVVDERGLYFDPARESDLEWLLNSRDCTPKEIFRAVALKKLILSARLSKYNLGDKSNLLLRAGDKPCVLVVGQVEDDESIKRGCDAVHTNADLLAAVREARPDAWIRYKPHPDVVAGNRKGAVPANVLAQCADSVDANASIVDCIDACDELHTMTSLSGFEALLRDKRVVTYGAPFYAGWGLTEDLQPIARRKRRRTLDELVYLCLIAYPRYVDIETGEFMTPEDLVETIKSQRAMKNKKSKGWSARQIGKAVNIVRGLRYAP